jgi:hypothetical protein
MDRLSGKKLLTKSSLLDLFRRQGQHGEYFRHNLDSHVCHRRRERDLLRMYMQAVEEAADTFKEIEERIIACRDAKSGLG